MPENVDAYDLWFAVRTQWRGGGMGVVGLDYGMVIDMARILKIDLTPALILKTRVLERAVLAAMRPKGAMDADQR